MRVRGADQHRLVDRCAIRDLFAVLTRIKDGVSQSRPVGLRARIWDWSRVALRAVSSLHCEWVSSLFPAWITGLELQVRYGDLEAGRLSGA